MRRIKKSEAPEIQGTCVQCGEAQQSHKGGGKFRALCLQCHNERYPKTLEYYRQYAASRRATPGYREAQKESGGKDAIFASRRRLAKSVDS